MTPVVWLVDMGYVIKASEGLFKLDYAKAQGVLRHELGPVQSWLFNSYNSHSGVEPSMEGFYRLMEEQHGMRVRLQPLGWDSHGAVAQRRVDVDLASTMVWLASRPELRSIVLTTGDQDFIPAVELVIEEYDREVILFSYDRYVSGELADAVDEHWLFEEFEARLAR
ncbi:MAG: NYN domain-containing protein [Armatimonadetes bacterium]|nr:NYN domain-containing protein [Armatimonadota bacterium]